MRTVLLLLAVGAGWGAVGLVRGYRTLERILQREPSSWEQFYGNDWSEL